MKVEITGRPSDLQIRVLFKGQSTLPLRQLHDGPAGITRIGIKTGSFDPFHPGHVILALQTILDGVNDQVIFLPNGDNPHGKQLSPFAVRYQAVQQAAGLFGQFLSCADFKERNTNSEVVRRVRQQFGEGVEINWIASSTGQSSRRILEKLSAGIPFDQALAEVVGPVDRYLYYYYLADQAADVLSQNPSPSLLVRQFPARYYPFSRVHSSDIRSGRLQCSFVPIEEGVLMSVLGE